MKSTNDRFLSKSRSVNELRDHPMWNEVYARQCIAEDGTVCSYGDYLAERLGYFSCAQMLDAQLDGTR